MGAFLEIVKYTLPSLVVFATAYYILKKYLDNQIIEKRIELSKDLIATKLPLKLQAYERLLLFCERIRPNNLVLRLQTPNMTNQHLRDALLISVQKEFEHNLAQQLYTSKSLWGIIRLAKDEVLNQISLSSATVDNNGNASELTTKLISIQFSEQNDPVELAINAIKEEAKMILN